MRRDVVNLSSDVIETATRLPSWTLKLALIGFYFLYIFSLPFRQLYCCTQCDRLLTKYCIAMSISLFASLSVTLYVIGLRVGVRDWKLCRRVRALPIHFFKHFHCMMYRLATRLQKQISVWILKPRHGYSKSRSVAKPYVVGVRAAITATTELYVWFWYVR